MLKQISIFMLVLAVVLVSGCSGRRTRQFIVADTRIEGFMAGDWLISKPAVVAFKDVINLEDISDTTMFWISMRAKRPRENTAGGSADLNIDSVKVSFLPDGGYYWRRPTRSTFYGDPKDKFIRKAFDFFGDQGIVIPAGVDSILVEYDALAVDERGTVVDRSYVTVRMQREEEKLLVPLLQE